MRLLISCLALWFAIPALAADEVDPGKAAQIRTLLELTGSAAAFQQSIALTVPEMRKLTPELPDAFWTSFQSKAQAADFASWLVPIYDRHFDEKELKALIKFYRTPAGRKMVAETPALMAESSEVGRLWGASLAAEIIAEQGVLTP